MLCALSNLFVEYAGTTALMKLVREEKRGVMSPERVLDSDGVVMPCQIAPTEIQKCKPTLKRVLWKTKVTGWVASLW